MLPHKNVNLRLPPGAKLYEPKPKWPGDFEPLKPELTVAQILAWADAHRARTRKWPTRKSGRVAEDPSEDWNSISSALYFGLRGLPRGSSLARLLAAERGVRNKMKLPRLTTRKILGWADAHFARHGTWPRRSSGLIPDSGGETWYGIHHAISHGKRGLTKDLTLEQLLAKKQQRNTLPKRPSLEIPRIVEWADAYFALHGRWPVRQSGGIPKTPGETWRGVEMALMKGKRGLPGGLTLAGLLEQERLGKHGCSP